MPTPSKPTANAWLSKATEGLPEFPTPAEAQAHPKALPKGPQQKAMPKPKQSPPVFRPLAPPQEIPQEVPLAPPEQVPQKAPLDLPQEDPQELETASAVGSETVQYHGLETLLAEALQNGLDDAEVAGMVAKLREHIITKQQILLSPNPEGPHPSASGYQGASAVYLYNGRPCTPPRDWDGYTMGHSENFIQVPPERTPISTPRRDADTVQQGAPAGGPLPEALQEPPVMRSAVGAQPLREVSLPEAPPQEEVHPEAPAEVAQEEVYTEAPAEVPHAENVAEEEQPEAPLPQAPQVEDQPEATAAVPLPEAAQPGEVHPEALAEVHPAEVLAEEEQPEAPPLQAPPVEVQQEAPAAVPLPPLSARPSSVVDIRLKGLHLQHSDDFRALNALGSGTFLEDVEYASLYDRDDRVPLNEDSWDSTPHHREHLDHHSCFEDSWEFKKAEEPFVGPLPKAQGLQAEAPPQSPETLQDQDIVG